MQKTLRKPPWLRVKVLGGAAKREVESLLARLSLNTVCNEAKCPNLMECFSRRTATFMILGSVCTRNCTFCSVSKGKPNEIDPEEPLNIAKAVRELNLNHVVITSVTRDDLADGGAHHFARVIREIRKLNPTTSIEVLIPDFAGNEKALSLVADAKPEIIAHNIETVPRLYSEVREMAVYERSLTLLKNIKRMVPEILTKSGLMVGLGETEEEVFDTMKDLGNAGCTLLTIGQYLSPTCNSHKVIEYISPDIFEKYRLEALKMGFQYVASGPLVRSSYYAEEAFKRTGGISFEKDAIV